MAKKILLFNLLLVVSSGIYAQCNPDFSTYIIDREAGEGRFWYTCSFNCSEKSNLKLETPPWIIGGGGEWRSYYTTNGSKSFVSSIEKGMIGDYWINFSEGGVGPTMITDKAGPYNPIAVAADLTLNQSRGPGFSKATNSITMEDGFNVDASTGDYFASIVNGLLGGQDWRRSYYNVYTAQYLNHPEEGTLTIGFLDAENKAMCDGNTLYPSSVHPYKPIYNEQSYACPDIGDFWPTMAGFVCASWVYNNVSNNYGQAYFDHDMGPITWPSNGYNQPDNINRAGVGVGLPSSIMYGGYMYVFYHDHGPMDLTGEPHVAREHGRGEGIKVVRAPISECLNPSAYRAYYKDPNGVEHWVPSLPAGFNKDNMDVFWSEKGPKCTDVTNDVDDLYDHKRFSVAHIANSNPACFISVETYAVRNTSTWKTALRYSTDLVNWSTDFPIETNIYDNIKLNYPVLCDFDSWSNTEIDINNFFVVGKGPIVDHIFNKYHIYAPGHRKAVNVTEADVKKALAAIATGIAPTPNKGIFTLNYSLEANAKVQINVMDITGRKVRSINPVVKAPGNYIENIDITSFGNGVYIIELITGDTRQTFKTVKR